MLIPPSAVNERRAADVWRDIFTTTWWLTVLLAAAAFLTAPLDFFPSADPFEHEVGVGDRFANGVLVVLVQNVVLLMVLFAAHVVRALEELQLATTTPRTSSSSTACSSSPEVPLIEPEGEPGKAQGN